MGMPLGVVLRDILRLASTMNEIKKLLHAKEVFVDGKRRRDHHLIIGLFDVLSIPILKKSYRLLLDRKGRVVVEEIGSEKESLLKPCKVVGKTILSKGRLQYNLHDGKNIISDKKAKVGDTLLLVFPKMDVKEVLSLQEGSIVFLSRGKHHGDVGTLKKIRGQEAIYSRAGKEKQEEIETSKDYLFVIGVKEPIITINSANMEKKNG